MPVLAGILGRIASVAEWSIATDCKSVDFGLRRFESFPAHYTQAEIANLTGRSIVRMAIKRPFVIFVRGSNYSGK
jgi:nicotinic acid phosphoribosyltransferase